VHLQSDGHEHCARGKAGASLLKKRLSLRRVASGHALDPATMLTACHGSLRGPRVLVFTTICGRSSVTEE